MPTVYPGGSKSAAQHLSRPFRPENSRAFFHHEQLLSLLCYHCGLGLQHTERIPHCRHGVVLTMRQDRLVSAEAAKCGCYMDGSRYYLSIITMLSWKERVRVGFFGKRHFDIL
jgi:hypothetical protein